MKELRWYQLEGIDAFWNYFRDKTGNPILAYPTGTGKALIIAETIRSVYNYYKNQRIMMLTDTKELIGQNYQELLEIWPTAPVCIYSAGLKRKETHAPIIFAGIDSVAKKAHLFGKINLLFVDECHTISPKEMTSYGQFIADLKKVNPHLKVIGYTATPYRMGQGLLTEPDKKGNPPLFTDICYDVTGMEKFNQLVAEGYLVKLVPKPVKAEIDTSDIKVSGYDFNEHDLQAAVDRDEITTAALKETIELASDRKSWLVFASGVQHAEHVAIKLNELGISACCIHSKLGDETRDRLLTEFKRGKYQALVNNGIFTKGFNHPPIDLIVMLRPTQSVSLWVQMLGRGTRPLWLPGYDVSTIAGRLACIEAGKKNCLVLDFAGNIRRLGPINDPMIPRKGKKGGPQEAPIKLCESCNTWNHTSVRFCDHCGAEFKFLTKLVTTAATEDLLAGEAPAVEIFRVSSISCSRHIKTGAPDSIKVTYFSKFQSFSEWVCPEHTNFAGKKARQWWGMRTRKAQMEGKNIGFPANTNEALEIIETLPTPTHLRVWLNKKPYPQIMDYDFSGTGWGTEAEKVTPPIARTQAQLSSRWASNKTTPTEEVKAVTYNDEDVPF